MMGTNLPNLDAKAIQKFAKDSIKNYPCRWHNCESYLNSWTMFERVSTHRLCPYFFLVYFAFNYPYE